MLATYVCLHFKALQKIRPIFAMPFAIVTTILISQFLLPCDINLIAGRSYRAIIKIIYEIFMQIYINVIYYFQKIIS